MGAGSHPRLRARSAGGQPAVNGRIEARKRKNDRIDANKLARLGRVDPASLYPIQHRGREVRQDPVMLRARDALVAVRTEIINTTEVWSRAWAGGYPSVPAGASHTGGNKPLPDKYAKRCCPWCVWQQH